MIKQQYCMKCGTLMELDFEKKRKVGQCYGCNLKFKYFLAKDGALSYIYNRADIADIYVECEEEDMRLIDIASKNAEVEASGKV